MSVPLLASIDGVVGPAADAMIPATDEGLLRGDGGFEVIRLYAGRPFALEEHYARLERTCAGLRLEPDVDALKAEVAELLDRAGAVEGLLRVVLTRGGRRVLLLEPLPQNPPTQSVRTVTYAPTRVLDGLKTLSYAANMLAGRLAKEDGADEALLVTPHGRVLEGPTWTLFWVSGGRLLTPPLSERILQSITRDHVMACCDVQERVTTLEELFDADEAFIASSVREAMPISAIDGRPLPAAPGPVTERVAAALREDVERTLSAA